jgi:hypothetical protein
LPYNCQLFRWEPIADLPIFSADINPGKKGF